MSMKRVLGRKDEYIVGLNGARPPSINFYTLFRDYTKISAFQLVQYSTLEVCAHPLFRTSVGRGKSASPTGARSAHRKRRPDLHRRAGEILTNSDGKVLIISRQMGSYKLSSFESYSLPAQHAWADQRQGSRLISSIGTRPTGRLIGSCCAVMRELFSSDHYLKWYPETRHAGLLKKLLRRTWLSSLDGYFFLRTAPTTAFA